MRDNLEAFLRDLPAQDIINQLSQEADISKSRATLILETFSNETRVTLDLVEEYLDKNIKILEVGAGLCIFSLFLKKQGFNIFALEPATSGFEVFSVAKRIILNLMSDYELKVIDSRIEELCDSEKEEFDLIFSNNVLEHIPDLAGAIKSMALVMKKNGMMVHSCPNYTVPYEPHLNIPVLKFWPGFSKQIFKKTIKEHIDVWESLNFISCKDVKKIAQQNNLIAIFSSGVMYKAFNRLDVDMVYADRQSGSFIQLLWRFFKLVHIDWVLKWMPASISTPMIFTLRKV